MNETETETVTVPRAEFETLVKQVAEIHEFIGILTQAMNNPMVRAMIPGNLRGQLGK